MVPEGLSQTTKVSRRQRDPSVQTVEFLLQNPSDFWFSFQEKRSVRLGDRVSTALLKILKKSDLENPANIRKFLPGPMALEAYFQNVDFVEYKAKDLKPR
jgi:hypothetical protein